MPPIFTIEKKVEIKETLLQSGEQLIREKGIKKMSIDDVTSMTGIGKGTFYHFFENKVSFVSAVLDYSKENIYQMLNQQIEEQGGISKEAFEKIIKQCIQSGGGSLFHYMTSEDEAWLLAKLPEKYQADSAREQEVLSKLEKYLIGTREQVNLHVTANLMKALAITIENRASMHQEVLEETLLVMAQELCNYIFL